MLSNGHTSRSSRAVSATISARRTSRAGEADFERIFVQAPRDTPFADEPQGEAVTFSGDGKSYFTASEHTLADVLLYQSICR